MDLFKFNSPSGPTYFTQGSPVEGWDSVRWVERYQEPGEFKIVAPLGSGLHNELPKGSFISHVATPEIMVVENHEIEEDLETSPMITISGRSLDVILDDRVIGCDQDWSSHDGVKIPYYIYPDDTRDQIADMINDHIRVTMAYAGQLLPNVRAASIPKAANHVPDISEERFPKRGSLLERVKDLLQVDDLGIKVQRRGWLKPGNPQWDITFFYIHSGQDLSDRVIFSWEHGDISRANYLFSQKKRKNAALVSSTYVEAAVEPVETGIDRKWMHVDASDVDSDLDGSPDAGQIATIKAILISRGQEALQAQEDVDIFDATLSDLSQYTYREDYNIGDVVSVEGSFGDRERRRVIEHVEVVDEDGSTSMPTLAAFNRQA
ncbi:hypothetical protein KC887_02255 [Candidatus Kaiserbacteria bacterium]|nr:hypothetical protein [Candidatus Kaiserbacteria bacterium]